jgi:hypothetical protein
LRIRPSIDDVHAAHHRVGGRHGHRAHLVAADVLLHFDHDANIRAVFGLRRDFERVVELGQMSSLELDVEHRSDDLNDLADVMNYRSSSHD